MVSKFSSSLILLVNGASPLSLSIGRGSLVFPSASPVSLRRGIGSERRERNSKVREEIVSRRTPLAKARPKTYPGDFTSADKTVVTINKKRSCR